MTLRSDLAVVSGLAVAELDSVWALPPTELEASLTDSLPAILDAYALAAGAAAADAYDDLRDAAEVAGRFAAIVAPLREFGIESLVKWGVKPLFRDVPDLATARSLIEGGVQKRIVNAGNESFTMSAAEDPQARGYQRITRAGACDFCRLVASRGGVYTKASATFACHERCHCSAVPAWGGRAIPVAAYTPSIRYRSDETRRRDNERARQWIADNLT